jgi:hypothetical protein
MHDDRQSLSPNSHKNVDVSNQKRLEALEQRQRMDERKKDMVKEALENIDSNTRKNGHVTFDDEVGGEPADNTESKEEKKQLFDWASSDEDLAQDEENHEGVALEDMNGLFLKDFLCQILTILQLDFKIERNPVFEGSGGQERLALQSKFKGDERFKLDTRFIDEDESEDDNEIAYDTSEQQQLAEEMQREKSTNMSILDSILPPSNAEIVRQSQQQSSQRYVVFSYFVAFVYLLF